MTIATVISTFSPVLPLSVSLRFINRLDKPLKVMVIYIAVSFVFDVASLVVGSSRALVLYLVNIYTPVEFLLLWFVFYNWTEEDSSRRVMRFLPPMFLLFWVVAKMTFEGFASFDAYSSSVASLVMIALALIQFVILIRSELIAISSKPRFWFSLGVLIYFSGMILMFATADIIMTLAMKNLISVPPIHSALNVTKHLCFTGGFRCLSLHRQSGGQLS